MLSFLGEGRVRGRQGIKYHLPFQCNDKPLIRVQIRYADPALFSRWCERVKDAAKPVPFPQVSYIFRARNPPFDLLGGLSARGA
jgi:hypothetical protein